MYNQHQGGSQSHNRSNSRNRNDNETSVPPWRNRESDKDRDEQGRGRPFRRSNQRNFRGREPNFESNSPADFAAMQQRLAQLETTLQNMNVNVPSPSPSTSQRYGAIPRHPMRSNERNDRGGGSRSNERNDRGGGSRSNERNDRGGGSRSNRQNPRQDNDTDGTERARGARNRHFVMAFKHLEALCKKEPEEVIVELANDRNGFFRRIEDNLSGDYIVLIVRVLEKMCSSAFNSNKTLVITEVAKESFMEQLKKFVLEVPLHNVIDKKRNKFFWYNIDQFWRDLHILCNTILELIPTTAIEVLPKLVTAVQMAVISIEKLHNVQISDDIKQNYEILQEKILITTEEIEKKVHVQEHKRVVSNEEEMLPPNNFREMSVYPTSEEIINPDRSFVRKNKIDRPYNNVEEYLDIQFRLLREDFVAPLRQGVCEYTEKLANKSGKRIHSVRIHQRVQFIGNTNVRDLIGIKVLFELDKKKQKRKLSRYELSKRFMFGGLVCFTKDNFQSFIFGKIIDRDQKLLEQSTVVVHFENDVQYMLYTDYVMVECNVYFEPYYVVLNALQKIDAESFPMEKYIIRVDPQMSSPAYLTAKTVFQISSANVRLLDSNSWPSEGHLKLNTTQYQAFKAGLTQEFCIIQGPPGTGKTYLGLKIVRTLLQNKSAWHKSSPILIVCYTNHALDQFLEGLLNETKDIIRIGSQSKNENLKQFNLTEARRKFLRNCGSSDIGHFMFHKKNEIKGIVAQIKEYNETLDVIKNCESILSFHCFEKIDQDIRKSWFARATNEEILLWLLGGRTRRDRNIERRAVQIKQQIQMQNSAVLEESPDENENEEFYDAMNREENKLDIDDEEWLTGIAPVMPKIILSLEKLRKDAATTEAELRMCEQSQYLEEFNRSYTLLSVWERLMDTIEYTQERLEQWKHLKDPTKPENANLKDPHNMTADDRWALYFHWLHKYVASLTVYNDALGTKFRAVVREYDEIKSIEDVKVMKESLILGMTTTAAARLQTTLQALKCNIVVVEEAAEVLEAHLVASLTKHCQQLILIGDHQQLRPSTADYRMETYFKLGISLFERMVLNKLHLNVLGVQHRMRPEISRLICPSIYPNLIDHESVKNFPPVRGIDHCLYFIDHEQKESLYGDSTKQNLHEARFLVHLARHLVLNGYEPHEITILAAYLGQWLAIDEEKKNYQHILGGVRVAVLDNYQGEECTIILLSLVRNNDQGSIGFLKIENRVCVALSRAREGLYIMGNMELLCKNSDVWPKIKSALVEQDLLGPALQLRCRVHQDRVTRVKNVSDFDQVSEGGCNQLCMADLDCGHTCVRLCHIYDRDHQNYKCKQPCTKLLCQDPTHICRKYCFEECGPCTYKVLRVLPCGHEHTIDCHIDPTEYRCYIPVPTDLPCTHKADKPCYMDADRFKCPHPCEIRVEPCGHMCERTCHIKHDPDHTEYKCKKLCAKYREGCTLNTHLCPNFCFEKCAPCDIKVQKERNCSHFYKIDCNEDVNEIVCDKPCKKTLPCGHRCRKKCCEPCGDCQVEVDKVLPLCNHTVKSKCSEPPNRKQCIGNCPLLLSCGHPCRKRCNEVCTTKCLFMVEYHVNAACGHRFNVPCHVSQSAITDPLDPTLLSYCDKPCTATLKCEHKCAGTCGTCLQGRIHQTCQEKCGVPLVCGHECTVPCRKICQPCTRACNYRCPHAKCGKKCGDPCTPCKEPCTRKCAHVQCTARCGQLCTVEPCVEPCPKKLKCDHPCVGFCGDPCPPLCRICDKEELEEIFFGTEDSEDARFVFLQDCKHVIESTGMEEWLTQRGEKEEINAKTCPKCKTLLTSTRRYSNYIIRAMENVIQIKRKFFGNDADNLKKRAELVQNLAVIEAKIHDTGMESAILYKTLEDLTARLRLTRKDRVQVLHSIAANAVTAKIQLLDNIVDIYEGHNLSPQGKRRIMKYLDQILKILIRESDRITDQEISDIQTELSRATRIVELIKIEESAGFTPACAQPNVKDIHSRLVDLLFSLNVFSEQNEEVAKKLLEELNSIVKASLKITEKERREIVQALRMSTGHWFKCPNGHIYVIGECGGAMEVGKCNECGAKIGGSSHTLLGDNRLAPEMDGARHPAWSEAANMQNYGFFGRMF